MNKDGVYYKGMMLERVKGWKIECTLQLKCGGLISSEEFVSTDTMPEAVELLEKYGWDFDYTDADGTEHLVCPVCLEHLKEK